MKRNIFLTILSSIIGIAAGAVRFLELQTAYDSYTGLMQKNNIYTIVLYILTAILATVLLSVLAIQKKAIDIEVKKGKQTIKTLFAISVVFMIAGGTVMAISAYFVLKTTYIILGIFAVFTAFAFTSLSGILGKKKENGEYEIMSLVPVFFVSLWIINEFRYDASNPTIALYFFKMVTLIAATLMFFKIVGAFYEKPSTKATMFFANFVIFGSLLNIMGDGGYLVFGKQRQSFPIYNGFLNTEVAKISLFFGILFFAYATLFILNKAKDKKAKEITGE